MLSASGTAGLPRPVLRLFANLRPHMDKLQWRVHSGDNHVTVELTWRFPDPRLTRPASVWTRLRRSLTISPARPASGGVPENTRRVVNELNGGSGKREWRRSVSARSDWRRASFGDRLHHAGAISPVADAVGSPFNRCNSWPRQPASKVKQLTSVSNAPSIPPSASTPYETTPANAEVTPSFCRDDVTPIACSTMITSTPRESTTMHSKTLTRSNTPARLSYRYRDDIHASVERLTQSFRQQSQKALENIRSEWQRSLRDWPPRPDTSSTDSENSTAGLTPKRRINFTNDSVCDHNSTLII